MELYANIFYRVIVCGGVPAEMAGPQYIDKKLPYDLLRSPLWYAVFIQVYSWGLNPKALQVIEFSVRLVKDVDDHIIVIQQDPMPFLFPF